MNIIKNNISNNRGSVSGNIVKGLSVGVFAAIIGYSIYVSYNNSPAYNPARRGIYTGEGQNLSANSLEGFMLTFDDSNHLPDGAVNGSGVIHTGSGFVSANSVRKQFSKEEADFEAAREYMASQKEAKARQAAQAKQAANNTALNSKDSVRNSYSRTGAFSESEAAEGQSSKKTAKATKAKSEKGTTQKDQTQLNKLASSGASSVGSSSGGGSKSGGSSSSNSGNLYARASDTGSKALPQNNIANSQAQANAKAFQFGRGGAMGGVNVARNGGGSGSDDGGKRGGGNVKAELSSANMYSTRAGKTLQATGAKDLAQAKQEADNAFDGGGIIGGATINGDKVVDPGAGDFDLNPGGDVLRGIQDTEDELEDLASERRRLTQYVVYHLIYAAIAALSAAIAIAALSKEPNFWTEAACVAIAGIAAYSIWFKDYDGDGMSIHQTLNRLHTLDSDIQWLAYPVMTLLTGVVGASMIYGEKIANWAEEHIAGLWNILVPTATIKQVTGALRGVANFAINKIDDK